MIADKYVVERVLGRGGMGTVYSVTHKLTGKRLALKCLLPTYVNNPNIVERFLREARAAGRIQHRHVIDVFDAGRDGDVLYIVMPLLEGKPLAELLHDEHLTLDEALVILVRAMEGVAAAHEQGIVHRDLKPGNIFVCVGVSGRLDDPRVLDFGISKLDDELSSPLTRSGVAVGTPYYMAIEQLTGQRDLDHRVDIYALGVILYEAMVGRPPHTAENVASLALRLMHTLPTHLGALRRDLPPGLADVVMRALARDREDRFPNVRALIDALVPFVSKSAGLTVPDPHGRPLRTPRDTEEPGLPSELARASATTAPSGRSTQETPVLRSEPPTPPSAEAQASVRPRGGWLRRVQGTPAIGLAGLVMLAALAASSLLPDDAPPRTREATPSEARLGAAAQPRTAVEDDALALNRTQSDEHAGSALLDASQPSSSQRDGAVPKVAPSAARPRRRKEVSESPQPVAAPSEPSRESESQPSNAAAHTDVRPTITTPVDKAAPASSPEPARAGSLAPEEF